MSQFNCWAGLAKWRLGQRHDLLYYLVGRQIANETGVEIKTGVQIERP